MKLQLLFVLMTLSSQSILAAAISKDECLDKVDYSVGFSLPGFVSVKIYKNQNKMKFVVFNGRGERKELDLSRGDIGIDIFTAIDATEHRNVHPGSANCEKPLFGADFEMTDGDAETYASARARIYELLQAAEKNYAKDPNTSVKLSCSAALLRRYLDHCEAIEAPKVESSKASFGDSLPPGVHPQTILKTY